MSSDPNEHDFDWVTARHRCSLPGEFERLKCAIGENCAARRKCLAADEQTQFNVEGGDSDNFSVTRKQTSGGLGGVHRVRFYLRLDHICIVETRNEQERRRFAVTLTLNDEGECRFLIDGEGEYLRWQVARRALCPLFFPDTSKRVGT